MKLIREYISEKFEEDSDPIYDLDIGGYSFETIKPGAVFKVRPEYKSYLALTSNKSGKFISCPYGARLDKNDYLVVTQVIRYDNGYKDIHFKKFWNKEQSETYRKQFEKIIKNIPWEGLNTRMIISKIMFDRRFEIIERGFDFLKESLNEKFEENSDPINDLGIGQKYLIKKWIDKINCAKCRGTGITQYKINDDLSINVLTSASLPDNYGDIPKYIKFNKINGRFNIADCCMTTFRGCPKIVNGDFICLRNKIKSLKYLPKIVNGDFEISKETGFTEEDIRNVCKISGQVIII
jgi:hypothetical protein